MVATNQTDLLTLHYVFGDKSHSMDAVVRNKCEAELLGIAVELARILKVPLTIETHAYREGGLKELWKFLGHNKDQLGWLLAVLTLILTRFPTNPADKETEAYNKEAARLTVQEKQLAIEEKRLNLEKLKRELEKGLPERAEAADEAASALSDNIKIVARRSNFYTNLLKYEKVVAFGVAPYDYRKEAVVERRDFGKFVMATDKLPAEVIEEATVEIIAPVIREGGYEWKGIYDGVAISFKMGDAEFKDSVLRGEVAFQHGTAIQCELLVHRKVDELGEIVITGYTVNMVLAKIDGQNNVQTPQGRRRRYDRSMAATQTDLFDRRR